MGAPLAGTAPVTAPPAQERDSSAAAVVPQQIPIPDIVPGGKVVEGVVANGGTAAVPTEAAPMEVEGTPAAAAAGASPPAAAPTATTAAPVSGGQKEGSDVFDALKSMVQNTPTSSARPSPVTTATAPGFASADHAPPPGAEQQQDYARRSMHPLKVGFYECLIRQMMDDEFMDEALSLKNRCGLREAGHVEPNHLFKMY